MDRLERLYSFWTRSGGADSKRQASPGVRRHAPGSPELTRADRTPTIDAPAAPPEAPEPAGPDPLLADDVVRLVAELGGGRHSVRMLTHILRASRGPVTQEIIAEHKLYWLPSTRLPQKRWTADRDLVRASCDADRRLLRDEWDMVSLAPRLERALVEAARLDRKKRRRPRKRSVAGDPR